MKRFALVASASLALLVGACDDDPPPKRDAGTDARDMGGEAGAEVGAPGQCIGTFATTNRTFLGAAVASKPEAKCRASTDLDLICSSDIGGRIRNEIAPGCLVNLQQGNAAVVSCIEVGVKRDVGPISDGCLSCYTASVVCSLDNCRVACGTAPASSACMTCQAVNGCIAAFFACSGLPGGPTTPPADGGTDTTTPADAPADSPVDAGVDSAVDTAVDAASDTGSDV
jgi:hypothetical protein